MCSYFSSLYFSQITENTSFNSSSGVSSGKEPIDNVDSWELELGEASSSIDDIGNHNFNNDQQNGGNDDDDADSAYNGVQNISSTD